MAALTALPGWEQVGVDAGSAFFTALFVGVAAVLVTGNLREKAERRAALRESFGRFLTMQRRSRELSLRLSQLPLSSEPLIRVAVADEAVAAYDAFVEEYHRLTLEADRTMWVHARFLQDTLKEMLASALSGSACDDLAAEAAAHRRALEDSFRHQLRHSKIHDRPDPANLRKRSVQQPTETA